jgi:multiple sugar transport system substrate-binding protein
MPNGTLFQVMDLNLQTDLRALAKKHNYDLSRIDQGLIKSIQQYSPNGELYALPASKGAVVLLYNKDIFDKFGVPYPKGHMQWDEVYDLTKKLTRAADGVQYKGFNPDGIGTFSTQLQLNYFDKNNKATFTKDEGWKKAADMWLKFRTLPGNEPNKGGRDSFTKDKDTAMIVTQVSFLIRQPVAGLNYDMVESPTFENNLRTNGLGTMFVITSTSKHQDDAFDVIQLYHSDEVQTAIMRDAGLFTELNNADIQKQFGANKPELKSLNMQANFKVDQAIKIVSRYEGEGTKAITNALNAAAKGQSDVNTALRQAEEALNARMSELLGGGK